MLLTVSEVLTRAAEARPNALSSATLLRVLNDTEERVRSELLGLAAGEGVPYAAVNAAELLLLPPYDELYFYSLIAETDFLLGETNLYQNDKTRADELWSDIRFLLCRRGRRAVFGKLLRLRADTSATLSLGDFPLRDDDVSAISVSFRAGGLTVLTKTEADAGVRVDGGVLSVPLSTEEIALLTPGTVSVCASLTSRDDAVTVLSETLRLFLKGGGV